MPLDRHAINRSQEIGGAAHSTKLGTWKSADVWGASRMPQAHIDVRYVANLAYLELSDAEIQRMRTPYQN